MPPDPASLRCLWRSNLSFRAYTFKTAIREWDFVHIMTHDSMHHPLFVYLRYIGWISCVASRASKLLLDGIKNIYTDKNSCTQAIPWRLALICRFTPGGGVLPYKGLMGTCDQPRYVFRNFCLKQGIEFIIFCLNQGIDLSIFVLNRINVLNRVSKIGILS